MITEQAIVSARDGERIEIRLLRGSACGHCELQPGCGMSAIGRLLGRRDYPIVISSDKTLNPGDRLQLELSEAALVKSSLTVYGYPLLGLVGGGLVASGFGLSDSLVTALAVTGFALGFAVARYRAGRLEEIELTPHIVDIQVNPATRSGS